MAKTKKRAARKRPAAKSPRQMRLELREKEKVIGWRHSRPRYAKDEADGSE